MPVVCTTPNLQKAIDMCFSIAIALDRVSPKPRGDAEITKWVRRELRLLGFPTSPCGASHGVLDSKPNSTPTIVCTCGTHIDTTLVGGQYQYTWTGRCQKCNIEWCTDYEQYQGDL